MSDELDFYDGMSGAGFENMNGNNFVIPMLLVAQKMSSIVDDGIVKLGDFYNSVTKESYGPSLQLIPVYFDTVWQIWKPNMGGFVGRVHPNSIPVSGDVYKGMTTPNPEGGEANIVDETWLYFVLLADKPEAGIMMMPVTSTGIKHAKVWNSLIHDTRTASGKRAPFFYKSWLLTTHKNDFDKGASWTFGEGSKTDILPGDVVAKEVYLEHVAPALKIAPAAVYGEGNATIDAPTPQLAIADTSVNEKY